MTTPERTRCSITSTHLASEKVDFAMADDRGRALGASIAIGTRTATPDEAATWLVPAEGLGLKYTAKVQPTRNGAAYGASIRSTLHNTREEAEAAARKRAEATRKRYQKKFG